MLRFADVPLHFVQASSQPHHAEIHTEPAVVTFHHDDKAEFKRILADKPGYGSSDAKGASSSASAGVEVKGGGYKYPPSDRQPPLPKKVVDGTCMRLLRCAAAASICSTQLLFVSEFRG